MVTRLDNYKYRGLSGFSYINYAKLLYDTLRSDPRYGDSIVTAKIAGVKSSLGAGASSLVGGALAATIGLGWQQGTGGAILLKGCPVKSITILERSNWARIKCFYPLPEGKYGDAVISWKTKGVFSKQIIGLDVKGHNVPGLTDIKKDQELLDKILALFRTRLAFAFEEWKARIRIYFEKKKGTRFGIVEYGMLRDSGRVEKIQKKFGGDYFEVTRNLFNIANDLASRIEKASIQH